MFCALISVGRQNFQHDDIMFHLFSSILILSYVSHLQAAPLQKDALMEDNEGNGTFGGDFGGHDDYDDYNDAGPASPVSSKQGGVSLQD